MNTKLIKAIIIIMGILTIIPILIYIFNFTGTKISGNPQDWSSLGSYIGGILTPIISLANLGVFIYLTTIVSKMDEKRNKIQLETQKKITLTQMRQNKINELSTVINEAIYNITNRDKEFVYRKINYLRIMLSGLREHQVFIFPIIKNENIIDIIKSLDNCLDSFCTDVVNRIGLTVSTVENEEISNLMNDYFNKILKFKGFLIKELQEFTVKELA